MSGEQLERSILERKEREELKAIATAMSLEPVARTKKADLVDQILRAAGVEVSEGGNANGAPPGPGGSAPKGGDASGEGMAVTAVLPAARADDGVLTVSATGESPNGKAARPWAARTRTVKPKLDPGGTAGTALSDAGSTGVDPGQSTVTAGPDPGSGHTEGGAVAFPGPSGRDNGGEGTSEVAPVDEATTDRRTPRRSAAASRRGAASNGAGSLSHASPEADSTSDDSPAGGTGAGSEPAPDSGRISGPAAADAPSNGNAASPAGTQGADRSGFSASHVPQQQRPQRQQPDRQQPDRQQGHNQGNQGNQGSQQGNQQGEAGNRRGRRRRGRERERGSELQAGGQPDATWQGELVPVKGLVDLREEGYGFLRTSGYLASSKDVYVSVNQARRFALRRGDALEGACRPAGPSEKYPALLRIDTVNGMSPDEARERPRFEDLTPLFPDERLRLESLSDPSNVTARIIDLISPIGKGQRGMIVSPSKAGKTTIMKQIAHSVELNNPDVHLMVLLVDERPEEVTDMRRSVKGEVIASTFDRPADEHTALSELTMERAKRLVEMGQDVVIILDGITRLARAYNLAQPATGRIMSGGVDSGALYPPKKFFGAARNVEEGGSLTILATALIETGSKMDEVIFEEFKGTGNMELRLDRKLAERRIYPAIDVNASSTRHEELLFDRSQLQQVWKLRRVLNALGAEGSAAAGLELLMDKIKTTRSNDEFLAEIAKAPTPSN